MHRTASTQRVFSYVSKVRIILLIIVVIREDTRSPWSFKHLLALQSIGTFLTLINAETCSTVSSMYR